MCRVYEVIHCQQMWVATNIGRLPPGASARRCGQVKDCDSRPQCFTPAGVSPTHLDERHKVVLYAVVGQLLPDLAE